MIANIAITKHAPVIAPPVSAVIADLAFDGDTFAKLLAVVAGLAFGAMWRVGSLRSERKEWVDVRADVFISTMIGGANAVMALAIVQYFGFNTLFSMAIGVVVGATGLRALPEIRAAIVGIVRKKLLEDTMLVVPPRPQPALDDLARQADEALRRDAMTRQAGKNALDKED